MHDEVKTSRRSLVQRWLPKSRIAVLFSAEDTTVQSGDGGNRTLMYSGPTVGMTVVGRRAASHPEAIGAPIPRFVSDTRRSVGQRSRPVDCKRTGRDLNPLNLAVVIHVLRTGSRVCADYFRFFFNGLRICFHTKRLRAGSSRTNCCWRVSMTATPPRGRLT